MPDLRTLTLEERHALAIEAERRARAGDAPKDIRAALGVSQRAYSSWAKLFGFRQCDLHPEKKRAGAQATLPPGPGGYARSGRMLRGLPARPGDGRRVYGPDHPAWRGGPELSRARYGLLRAARKAEARREVELLGAAGAVHAAVTEALAAGEVERADHMLAAWAHLRRRRKTLNVLKSAVTSETAAERAEAEAASDAAMCEELSRLLGRKVEL